MFGTLKNDQLTEKLIDAFFGFLFGLLASIASDLYKEFSEAAKLEITKIDQLGLHEVRIDDTTRQFFDHNETDGLVKKKDFDSIVQILSEKRYWTSKEIDFALETIGYIKRDGERGIDPCNKALEKIKSGSLIIFEDLSFLPIVRSQQLVKQTSQTIKDSLKSFSQWQGAWNVNLNVLYKSLYACKIKRCGRLALKLRVVNIGKADASIKKAKVKFRGSYIKYSLFNSAEEEGCITVKPFTQSESIAVWLKPGPDRSESNWEKSIQGKSKDEFQVILETTTGEIEKTERLRVN